MIVPLFPIHLVKPTGGAATKPSFVRLAMDMNAMPIFKARLLSFSHFVYFSAMTNGSDIDPGSADYVQWLDEVWQRRHSVMPAGAHTLSVGILLWPGFPLMSLTGILESLRHAGDFGDMSRQIEGRWEIMGAGGPVRSSCGIEVRPTQTYLHPGEFDYLFVVGGLLPQLANAPAGHRRYIHAARQMGCTVVGVCTGSFVLAEEHLLSRVTASIHPYHRRDYETAFPGHRLTTSQDFVAADGIATVPGGISILAYMAQIVSAHFGADRSAKVVHQLSVPDRRGVGEFERSGMVRHREIADPRLQKAIVMIESGLDAAAGVAEVASRLGMSERHFSRLFHTEIGKSPREYILTTRLRLANWLLCHTTKSITTIAFEAGFSSPAHLSATFRKKLGKTPTQVRREP